MIDQLKKLAELQGKASELIDARLLRHSSMHADCDFYVAARNIDLPALVAYVERLEAQNWFYEKHASADLVKRANALKQEG